MAKKSSIVEGTRLTVSRNGLKPLSKNCMLGNNSETNQWILCL